MNEDNLLNRLRQNRQRSNVPKRDDPLIPSEDKEPQQKLTPTEAEPKQASSDDLTLVNLKAELDKYPETKRHSAIVLEKKLDIELTRYCKDKGITVETFLEAAWTVATANPELLNRVTDEAQIRYKSRKEAGRLRRLITMLSKHS
ncbi:MAG: hypothetical protein AB4368_15390 [Xenococcaceae cyanobacterium]